MKRYFTTEHKQREIDFQQDYEIKHTDTKVIEEKVPKPETTSKLYTKLRVNRSHTSTLCLSTIKSRTIK